MPRQEYSRIDLQVTITPLPDERVNIQWGASSKEYSLASSTPSISDDLGVRFAAVLPPDFRTDIESPERIKVFRVTLDIEPTLASIGWEAIFQPALPYLKHPDPTLAWNPWTLVRLSSVRPRFLTLPFTVPMRVLQMNARPEHNVPRFVLSVFGSHPAASVDLAMMAQAVSGWSAPEFWQTVEVLHIDHMPSFAMPEVAMTTAHPDLPCTLGWIARRTERWQTRLVVLHCNPQESPIARRFAHALVSKGGPAVMVVEAEAAAEAFYSNFYEELVHDQPLDLIPNVETGVQRSLFAGSGREEGTRISNVGAMLYELSLAPFPALIPPGIRSFAMQWESWQFDLHEGDGLVPMAAAIQSLRVPRFVDPLAPAPAMESVTQRFVNSSIWEDATDGLERVAQQEAVLEVGDRYQLCVQIGPADTEVLVLNTEALFEEVFKWSPSIPGVWVEIGVAGIDFDVIGDAVQELWLPREGASEPLYFAISPRTAKVASLRFGLYYKNNLLQSFLMAAKTRSRDTPPGSPAELAVALNAPKSQLYNLGYLARLEYSRTTDLSSVSTQPDRALTLTANDLAGREVFVVKGNDIFTHSVKVDGIGGIVTQIRNILSEISYSGAGPNPPYQFTPGAAGIEGRSEEALLRLAAAGYKLFSRLAPDDKTQKAIRSVLDGETKTIHAANIHREKTVPWAFFYDAPFDGNNTTNSRGACMAAVMPDGQFRKTQCGDLPECLLHQDRQKELAAKSLPPYDRLTVACPLHFWGFRHIIEVPPRQVEEESDKKVKDKSSSANEQTSIKPVGQVHLVAGLNASLGLHGSHWGQLKGTREWEARYEREEILNLLKNEELDIVYFFCHAFGGQAATGTDPHLEFKGQTTPIGKIEPSNLASLGVTWHHGPLVILNACGTLGYAPGELSPFLEQLVDGRGASGVIGTEVPVAEILATSFAERFIEDFLNGEKAGAILLKIRRRFLAENIPLGLAYTLFAPAQLALDIKAPRSGAGSLAGG